MCRSTVVLALGLLLVSCGGDTNEAEKFNAETDTIIQSWIRRLDG